MIELSEEKLRFAVLKVSQPIGEFYVGILPAAVLMEIAYADRRRQENKEIDAYTGIQRDLSLRRKEEIRQYISRFDSSFPNSFIIQVQPHDVIEETSSHLTLRRHDRVASVIDGQHRLSGFDLSNSEGFDLIVSIFIDLPREEQAMLFATINLRQTRVSESLVYDLFEETKGRSPQKTAHDVCKSLNRDAESPFFQQIKPLGKRTDEYVGRLSQATFVKRLLPHICTDPDGVRDEIRRGHVPRVEDERFGECVLWRFFAREEDWAIQKVMKNYFNAVRAVFPEEWSSQNSALSRTIGFSALMRLFAALGRIGSIQPHKPRFDEAFFRGYFAKAQHLAPFSFGKYPASGKGETALYHDLKTAVEA